MLVPPIRFFEGSGFGEPRAKSMDQYSAGQFQLNVSGSRTGGTFDSDSGPTAHEVPPHHRQLAVSSDRRVVPRSARPCVARTGIQTSAQLGAGPAWQDQNLCCLLRHPRASWRSDVPGRRPH